MKGWESACLPEALAGGGPQPRVGTADLSHSVPGSMEAGAGAGQRRTGTHIAAGAAPAAVRGVQTPSLV